MSNGERHATPRVRRADLLLQSWNGLLQVLSKRYSAESQILGGAGRDSSNRDVQVLGVPDIDNAEKALQDKSVSLQYPFIAVALSSLEANTNSYNPTMLRRVGARGQISADRSTWSMLSLEPVIATFQVALITDDMVTMLRMMDRWMNTQLWSFMLVDPDHDFRVQVKTTPDKSFSVAPRAPDSGGTNQFRQACSVRLETYAGYVFYVPSVFQIDLQTKITNDVASALAAENRLEEFDLTTVLLPHDHQPVV